ncbi:MAG: tripartite tricarboxylate transporter substrate binding protein [Lautropia sp.]
MRRLIGILLLCLASTALGQSYPSRPVRLIVPFPPGGGADVVGRLLAESLSKRWKQAVVVDNRGGAATIIGTDAVAKAAPDGYTLLLATDIHAINAASGMDLPFDPIKDLAPVAKVIEFPLLLLASSKSGLRTVGDIVSEAKKQPGKLSAGSLGNNSPHFLSFRLLERVAGIQLLDVPYKGSGPAMTDLLGGQIDLMFGGISAGLSTAQGGRAVSVATTGTKRDPAAAELPTVIEAGYPGYVMMPWMCILAPAATPADVLKRVNADIVAALNDPALAKRLIEAGYTPAPSTPTELGTHIRTEIDKFRDLMKGLAKPATPS